MTRAMASKYILDSRNLSSNDIFCMSPTQRTDSAAALPTAGQGARASHRASGGLLALRGTQQENQTLSMGNPFASNRPSESSPPTL